MIARAQISASILPGSGASIRRISSVAGFSPVTPSSTRSTVLHSQQKRFMPKICPNTPGRKHIDGVTFATCDPETMSGDKPAVTQNLVAGEWETNPAELIAMPDPLNGEPFIMQPCVREEGLDVYIQSLKSCPKYGLHNALFRPERYVLMGKVSQRAAERLEDPEVEHFFARLIQRVCPKSYAQAVAEVRVTRQFLYNFSGDQVRFLARSFGTPGDHAGQTTEGHRWPYGAVVIIAPFNFPLEIPALQLMGALYMGNKPLLKACSRVAIVMDQFLRLLHECGLPKADVDFINTWGATMGTLLKKAEPRQTQFTGSTKVAEMLTEILKGKIKIEGGGFDWKLLGPDVPTNPQLFDLVAVQCDQDAYACSGQKCSAMSFLIMHENYSKAGLLDKLKALALKRNLTENLTVGPTLSVKPEHIKAHIESILTIPGSKILWGGHEINDGNHTIPECYGASAPTAIFVPLAEMMKDEEKFKIATKEIFAPFYVVTEYKDEDLPKVLEVLENIDEHLTAAIVSNSACFQNQVLANSLNGTTYVGLRARTTGAPQNHWFGPAGDPRAAGIGTAEAIRYTWSCHREIIHDIGMPPEDGVYEIPEQS